MREKGRNLSAPARGRSDKKREERESRRSQEKKKRALSVKRTEESGSHADFAL